MTQRNPISVARIGVQNYPYSIYCPSTASNSLYVGQNIYAFERTDPFTFEFFINPLAIGANANIFAECDNITPFQGIIIRLTSPSLLFKLVNTISSNEAQAGWTAPRVGTWTHVILSYDGTSSTTGMLAFYNGVLQTKTITTPNNLSASIVAPAGEGTRWGAFSGGSNGANAYLIPRRVLNYAITTEAQAKRLYKESVVPGAQALDEYPCTEGSGTNVNSTGSRGNDLTLVGSTIAWDSRSPMKARPVISQNRLPIS